MEFKNYSTISNTWNVKTMEMIGYFDYDRETYIVTEKAHGANFAIYYDGDKLRIASRNRFLADDDNFFGAQKVLSEYKEKIVGLFNYLSQSDPNKELIVYGELCGGKYPHPDVKPINDAKKVQAGVWYHPDNIFYVFDIKMNGVYLIPEELKHVCESEGIFYAKTLFKGSLAECVEYDNTYQTNIPKWLGLPPIEDNTCEGNVIKPAYKNIFFPNGSRLILKDKNKRFKEKEEKSHKIKIKNQNKLSEKGNELLSELLCYVTENRLNNVISKIGEVTPKDFGKIIRLLNKDVQDEFMSENQNELEHLDKNERKVLSKKLNRESAVLIRKYLGL